MSKVKKICKNCKLYNREEGVCRVNIIMEGEYYVLHVRPKDKCHWEETEKELKMELPIQQTRIWSDGTNGYIESPADDLGMGRFTPLD